MVVVHRAHGFRFVIYTFDHEPAHVHLTGAGQAKINLLGPDGKPEVVTSIGIKRTDMRRLMDQMLSSRHISSLSGRRFMDQKTDPQQEAQFDVAEARGREMLDTAMRAAEARYDRITGRVTIDLTNGCAYAFPAQPVQDLNGATDDQLAAVEVDGLGFNLHWPALDADLYVPALVSGVFGTRAWMAQELARRAGQATSPAKAAAARTNGAKGGRPRKVANG